MRHFLSAFCIAACVPLQAQWDWVQLATPGDMNFTLDLVFLSEDTGFVCGEYYSDEGDMGSRLYMTTDGGSSWQLRIGGGLDGDKITAMSFPDHHHGFAVSGALVLYHTSDGGVNWVADTIDHDCDGATDLCFWNAQTGFLQGYACNPFEAYKTSNAGGTWTDISEFNLFFDMDFLSSGIGYACMGDPDPIWHTTNGGAWWDQQQTPVLTGALSGIDACDPYHACAVGGNGQVLFTTTGGQVVWLSASAPTTTQHHLRDVALSITGAGIVVGYYGSSTNVVMTSENFGASWQPADVTTTRMSSAWMLDNGIGYISGHTEVWKVTSSIGINDASAQVTAPTIYPNPATTGFALLPSVDPGDTYEELVIYDAQGRVIHQRKNPDLQAWIDASSWPRGVYTCEVRGAGNTYARRVPLVLQ